MKKKTAPSPAPAEGTQPPAKITPIRTETLLCQYPFHQLGKSGAAINFKFTAANELGETVTVWSVSANEEYGAPGLLAYKIDTLIINRAIDEQRPDVPQIIKLGSLREIAEKMGSGCNQIKVKKALLQNASAFVVADLKYKGKDGAKRKFGFGDTRYGVIFAGQQLPGGRKADAVYIYLHPLYQELLQQARTRPLDYEYLQQLPPSCQRFYELISFRLFAALTNGNERAKYRYSELCKFAPLTRYTAREQARKQLFKLHRPHLASGYLAAAEMENSSDADGQPDWVLWYTPGPKAKAEFRQFNTKEGRAELNPQTPRLRVVPAAKQLPPAPPAPPPLNEEEKALAEQLTAYGITPPRARKLIAKHRPAVERELQVFPHRDRSSIKDQAAWLIRAIESGAYSAPAQPAARAPQQPPMPQQQEQAAQASAAAQHEQEARDRHFAAELVARKRYEQLSPAELQQRQAQVEAARADVASFSRDRGIWDIVLKSLVVEQLTAELAAAD